MTLKVVEPGSSSGAHAASQSCVRPAGQSVGSRVQSGLGAQGTGLKARVSGCI
jgi:hypothetical protein